jgi:hypothetical protein
MGRRFLLRPLGKCVNGENKFPGNGSSSIKHTHQLKILECQIPAKRLRKKKAVLAAAGAFEPPPERDCLHIYIAQIEKVGLGAL